MATITKITYAVDTQYEQGLEGKRLVYGTVEKEALAGWVGYEIINRMGVRLHVDADSIEALIAALIQARDFVVPL